MKKVTLITGSTMGKAEYIAEHIVDILEKYNFNTTVTYGPSLKDLPIKGVWLIVCSTHGAGELPKNIQPLAKEISEKKPDLSQVNYGAIGIGSKEYDTFCGAIHKLDQLLKNHHAKRIGEPLEINILEHEVPEDLAEIWIEKWKDNIINLA
ncbi:Sulfite reductase [NADPH] flavoprotein alpha-component [Arsenophonus endosymbiont of Aleurodicus dispersus]|uniref:FMN-binding protein MioC n=1 Tax=Arsenophonus endosymbiont of Aleurodicus dispersus TaxID=235559 RepID=UPI000EB5C10A|nr:FMN-binding protein MioC [Arsenophonus endosymbiont of Aleurodicus dispersus]VAY02321.1 Sulfite reductase [NADPH] flavoprotein alpha-component [Arsenophonus endosymbiont of Aleurodicus dispersus]